jgi:hypothetical protein
VEPVTRRRLSWTLPLTLLGAVVLGVMGLWLMGKLVISLDLDRDVQVGLHARLPFTTRVNQELQVQLDHEISADVQLGKELTVPIDEVLQIPIDIVLDVPIDSEVQVDQTIELELEVPIDTVLTQKELKLEKMRIPIDTEVFVDDVVKLSTVVPLDTTVTTVLGMQIPVKANLPVNLEIPIHQKMRVRDTLDIGVDDFRAPLRMTLPVRASVPFKQKLRVKGEIRVPFKRTLAVHVKHAIVAPVTDKMQATVKLHGALPVKLDAELRGDVEVAEDVPVRLGTIRLRPEAVQLTLE